MNASAIMVSDVITAKPDHTVQDVAQLLLVNRISAQCRSSTTPVRSSAL